MEIDQKKHYKEKSYKKINTYYIHFHVSFPDFFAGQYCKYK